MKRGFTLIELLAVIVILAIISLIATPIVLNIIIETKASATLRSAEFYLDAVEQSILRATLKNKTITNGVYNIIDGDICLNADCTDNLEVEVNGEKPGSGTITIHNGKIEDVTLNLNDKTIVKNDKNELVYKEESICTLVSGKEKEIGSKYSCEVKPGTKYNFFILSKEDEITNLIMERNICEDGSLATEHNACTVAWILDSTYGCGVDNDNTYCAKIYKGPVTAMNYTYNATKDWINVPNMIINYEDENINSSTQEKGTTGYGSIKTTNNITKITDKDGNETGTYTNLKARLPKYSEVNGNGCTTTSGSCPLWLVDYLASSDYYTEEDKTNIESIYGYWTLSSYVSDYDKYSWRVRAGGGIGDMSVDSVVNGGIRPVINIKL